MVENIQRMYTKPLSGCDHGLDCPFDIRLTVCVPCSSTESESDASSLFYGAFKEIGAFLCCLCTCGIHFYCPTPATVKWFVQRVG